MFPGLLTGLKTILRFTKPLKPCIFWDLLLSMKSGSLTKREGRKLLCKAKPVKTAKAVAGPWKCYQKQRREISIKVTGAITITQQNCMLVYFLLMAKFAGKITL